MKFVALVLALGLPAVALAHTDCRDVRSELEALRKAQKTILVSLANNHETFAQSFEEVSTEAQLNHMRIPAPFLDSMKKTAAAFRTRGEQAKAQADKLDHMTADVIREALACMDER